MLRTAMTPAKISLNLGKRYEKGISAEDRMVITIEFIIEPRKLQHAFKHAYVFGITGAWGSETAAEFEWTIRNHINSPNIKTIAGKYRGIIVTHFYDPVTRLWAAIDTNNNFVAAWKLDDRQIEHLNRSGNVQ